MPTPEHHSIGWIARVTDLLLGEKAPYVVTLFVAVLGFTANQTIARYNNGPTVEYAIKQTAVLGDVVAINDLSSASSAPKVFPTYLPPLTQAGYILSLENISSSHIVRCVRVELVLLPRPGGPPASISSWITSTSATAPVRRVGAESKDRPGVTILDMQPGGWLEIRMNAANVGDVSVVPRACSKDEMGSGAIAPDLPLVLPRNFGTVFAKHAMTVFWFGLACWTGLLALLFISRVRKAASNGSEA